MLHLRVIYIITCKQSRNIMMRRFSSSTFFLILFFLLLLLLLLLLVRRIHHSACIEHGTQSYKKENIYEYKNGIKMKRREREREKKTIHLP